MQVDARLRLTRDRGVWVPRLERLGQLRGLDRFAKTYVQRLLFLARVGLLLYSERSGDRQLVE